MRRFILAALLGGCGVTAPATQTKAPIAGADATPPSEAQRDGATLDCPAIANKIHTCADAFEAAYAQTTDAGDRGRKTVGGEPDGAAGAKTLMVAFRLPHNRDLVGVDLCNKSWATRDPRWTNRLHACDLSAGCEPFSACAATAIGEPLPPLPAD